MRLVCIDVDGTLVGSGGAVHPGVWSAAERARAAGLRLAICSGRPAFGLAREYAVRLDADGWHSFQNGASVLHVGTGESRSVRLPSEVVVRLKERARATGRVLEFYTDDDYVVEAESPRVVAHAALLGVPYAPRPFVALPEPYVRAQWLLSHEEAAETLAEPHPGLEIAPSTSPIMPDTTFLNMTPTGVTKATAVRAIALSYGITLAQVMFVGDGGNDAPAMRIVGHPVAMANAEESLHEIATYTVGHVDEGGLIEALDRAIGLASATAPSSLDFTSARASS